MKMITVTVFGARPEQEVQHPMTLTPELPFEAPPDGPHFDLSLSRLVQLVQWRFDLLPEGPLRAARVLICSTARFELISARVLVLGNWRPLLRPLKCLSVRACRLPCRRRHASNGTAIRRPSLEAAQATQGPAAIRGSNGGVLSLSEI